MGEFFKKITNMNFMNPCLPVSLIYRGLALTCVCLGLAAPSLTLSSPSHPHVHVCVRTCVYTFLGGKSYFLLLGGPR